MTRPFILRPTLISVMLATAACIVPVELDEELTSSSAGMRGSDSDPEPDPDPAPNDDGEDDPDPEPQCLPEDPCADAEGTGHLTGLKCDLGVEWIDEDGLSCDEAHQQCLEHAIDFPGHSYYCEWEGRPIFLSELEADDCGGDVEPCDDACELEDPCAGFEDQLGLYYGDQCEIDGSTILTPGISCEDALDNCMLNDSLSPEYGAHCTWAGRVIYRNDLGTDACVEEYGELECDAAAECDFSDPCAAAVGAFGFGVAIVGCDAEEGLQMVGISDDGWTCDDVVDTCLSRVDESPGVSLYCQWNNIPLVLHEAVEGECDTIAPC